MPVSGLAEALDVTNKETELREIAARIREHGVKHVFLQYVSIQGRVLGKMIPARHFDRYAANGIAWAFLSAGGFAISREGLPIGPKAIECSEGVLIPDLSTFQVLPWDHEMARVFCDHFHRADDDERPGRPVESDSRFNLKFQLEDFEREFGFEVRTGCEPEMSWFPDPAKPEPADLRLPHNVGPSYNIAAIEEMRPVIKRVTEYGQALGLDMIQADYEDPGQIEMNFGFGPALNTADQLVTYRQICIQVAKEEGILATFMPKPVQGIMANGCHHHFSLWSGDSPVFAGSDGSLNELGERAIGGVLTHARAMTAIVAPTVNSYTRFWEVGMFAPTNPCWGVENRQGLVRVLGGSRFEYRGPDASCNPYLSHAVLIAAVRDGMVNEIEPGPELIADEPSDRFPLLPTTLGEALGALREDPVVCGAFGEELVQTFIELKTDEWQRACGAITDWDRETYLHYLP